MKSRWVLLTIALICVASALVFFWFWSRPGTIAARWGLLGPLKAPGAGPPTQAQLVDRYRRLCEVLYGRQVPAPERTERHQWGEPEGDVLSLGWPIVVNFMADTGRVRGIDDKEATMNRESAEGPSTGPEPADPGSRNRYADLALGLFQRLGVDHAALVLDSVSKSTCKGQKRLVGRWRTLYDGIPHEHEGVLLAFDVTAPEPVFDTLGFSGVRPVPPSSAPVIEEREAIRIATECATGYFNKNTVKTQRGSVKFVTARTQERYVYRNDFFKYPFPGSQAYDLMDKRPETHRAYIIELQATAPNVSRARCVWVWVDCHTGEVVGGDVQL